MTNLNTIMEERRLQANRMKREEAMRKLREMERPLRDKDGFITAGAAMDFSMTIENFERILQLALEIETLER